ncbi:hypothetical protein C8Q72DRAFT_888385 [Fomitopsis betulina]|nr:hypothetical protein C8Q72DRAFT_888385 [Fomitopsis betulina]
MSTMFDDSEPASPLKALVVLASLEPEWRPILHLPNQVVLYNPTSHALSIRKHADETAGLVHRHVGNHCPFYHHALPTETHTEQRDGENGGDEFLLQISNGTASRPASRQARTIPEDTAGGGSNGNGSRSGTFGADNMAAGYFKAFFREEGRLDMGANGSVFLCQHMLDGNRLGHFAVKKIAVGQSHSYLLTILHENACVVTHHHAWLEMCQFSSFGRQVPTLHGQKVAVSTTSSTPAFADLATASRPASPTGPPSPAPEANPKSSSARIKTFRALHCAPPAERERVWRELGLAAENVPGRS